MKKNIKNYLFLTLISFLLLLIFSSTTSPLYGNYTDNDSSIFIYVGKMMKEGNILYKDIFDHKGPYLFFIEVLGQFIKDGKLGIFFIQTIFLSFTNIFLFKTAKLFTSNKKALLSTLISMFIFSFTITGGNLTEELSLPFIVLPMYLTVKWALSEDLFNRKIYLYSFIYGICFGILAFIRLNNALSIAAFTFIILIILIKNKEFKKLLLCACTFLIGLIITSLPIFLYFNAYNAVQDMIYATFIHNYLYTKANIPTKTTLLMKIGYVILFTLPYLIVSKKLYNYNKNIFYILGFALVINSIYSLLGFGFRHYYTLFIPLFLLDFTLFIELINFEIFKPLKWLVISISIIAFLSTLISPIYNMYMSDKVNIYELDEYINSTLSETDKTKTLVFPYFNPTVYYYGNIKPYNKYAFYLPFIFETNPTIMNEFVEDINNKKIEYVIISADLLKGEAIIPDQTKPFADMLLNNYHEIAYKEFTLLQPYSLYNLGLYIYEINK